MENIPVTPEQRKAAISMFDGLAKIIKFLPLKDRLNMIRKHMDIYEADPTEQNKRHLGTLMAVILASMRDETIEDMEREDTERIREQILAEQKVSDKTKADG